MSKKVKPPSGKKQIDLRTKARNRLIELESIHKDETLKNMINSFIEKYSICEIVYKVVLKDHQTNKKDDVKDETLKVDMRQVPHALNYAGYDFDSALLDHLFGSNETVNYKSAKKLRDELMHSQKKSSIQELTDREQELHGYMDEFLNKIRSFDENRN